MTPNPTPPNSLLTLVGNTPSGDITVAVNEAVNVLPPTEVDNTFAEQLVENGAIVAKDPGLYEIRASAKIEFDDGYGLLQLVSANRVEEGRLSAGGSTIKLSAVFFLNQNDSVQLVFAKYGGSSGGTLTNEPNTFSLQVRKL